MPLSYRNVKRWLWSLGLGLWVSVSADLLCYSLSGYHLNYIVNLFVIYFAMNATCSWLSQDNTVAGEIRNMTKLRSILDQIIFYVGTIVAIKFLEKGIRKVFLDEVVDSPNHM
jgi:hypothetical protein